MNYRFLKGLKIAGFVIVASFIFGFVIMQLWNWLMPAILGLHRITFWQGLGLFVLSKILFGGFHRHHGGHRPWKRHMAERWEQMSTEERERFRAGMRGRRGCRFVPPEESTSEHDPARRERSESTRGL
ncbi:MAG: hypothetical protein WA708_02045 [Acidobacteriaceae bacterium]